MRILVIDDEPQIRELVRDILASRSEYEVFCAHGGADGIAAAREHKPDIVLLDLSLKDMDGEEVWTVIQADGSCGKAIIMTGHIPDGDEAAKSNGILGVLTKPFSPVTLFNMLRNA